MSIQLIRKKGKFALLIFSVLFASAMFLGCEGDDGATGPKGEPGLGFEPQAESCEVCHSDTGDEHQAYYDQLYQDGVIVVTNLIYANGGGNDTVTFTMTKAGSDFDCTEADSLGIYFTTYIGTGFEQSGRISLTSGATTTYLGSGNCQVVVPESALGDLDLVDGLIVLYGRDEEVGRLPVRVRQVKYPFAALLETGPAGVDYASAANNDGCEKCHTVPFLKHGYIYGQVAGDPATDFYACKACHLDNGEGGHFIWQLLVDNPQLIFALEAEYGEDWEDLAWDAGDSRILPYAYTTRLMNDVHMSHAMEFPYPQSMSNCATCHEGKLTALLTDANFTGETCKSCHAVTGPGRDKQAPALATIMPAIHGTVDANYIDTTPCISCHDGTLPSAPLFSEIHTGYDTQIYSDAAGTKYSAVITVTIDSATLAGNDLTIQFSAAENPDLAGLDVADIVPSVLVGLYGYDTKHFYIGPHERDANRERFLEYDVDGVDDNPRFTTVTAAGGSWEVIADLSMWADLITDGTVKRAEIAVTPLLEDADGIKLALNGVSRTFDLGTNAFVDNYFQGTEALVEVDRCNNCHDALATTFHTNDPGRGGNIVVCRLCHITKSGGSHLEMQSRSIDSYAHAIHSFQAFDIGDIDFSDPLEALHYEHHTEFVFPTLGIRNCEACHNAGTYNAPDNSQSLPGALSGSDFPVIFSDGLQRNIGAVPMYITGPGARACGACHRAQAINEDDAGELGSLFSHWRSNGYLIEVVDTSNEEAEVLTVIDDIFATL